VTSNLVCQGVSCLISAMISILRSPVRKALPLLIVLSCAHVVGAAPKTHIITFGKWTTVQWSVDSGGPDDKPSALKVRPLLVDARVREFTIGTVHDVTDRLFVVRRAFRVNDSLPQEFVSPPHWQWQRGGWLLVDRVTGHVSALNLPEFDALYSAASWYRDYAAYCGVSEDGKKVFAIVAQINRRKPVLKKLLDGATPGGGQKDAAVLDSSCPVPGWERAPARVTFEPAGSTKQTFAIRGHAADLINESEEPEDEEASK
jgi:hypothetical protein